MTYKEDLIRVLRAENATLRNKIEFLEAKLDVNQEQIKNKYYEQKR